MLQRTASEHKSPRVETRGVHNEGTHLGGHDRQIGHGVEIWPERTDLSDALLGKGGFLPGIFEILTADARDIHVHICGCPHCPTSESQQRERPGVMIACQCLGQHKQRELRRAQGHCR